MADLSLNLAGIKSPNPFWLASAPPTNSGYQVQRAFEAGWGGAVWKTLGEPILNVSSRFAAVDFNGKNVAGFNNIELITDRPLEVNLKEIYETKKKYPNHAIIASLMVEPTQEKWHEIVKKVEDVGVDGLELNFGCPHGMAERGMGAASGQVPELVEKQTMWAKEVAQTPVIVKLTPNITDITFTAEAAVNGGADAVSMINTINSLAGVDLDSWDTVPNVAGKGAHGGYCGPAVKPIALNMVAECARHPKINVPISGMGGVSSWREAVEFMLMGATGVQVCTAAMHHGFSIVEDMIEGLDNYLEDKGMDSVMDIVGKSVEKYSDWGNLDLNHQVVAKINNEVCINCNKCHIACEDTSHQCIDMLKDAEGNDILKVREEDCVGCNLCSIVCPVDGAIDMVEYANGKPPMTWNERQAAIGAASSCDVNLIK
ncbi:dihydroorotate oxidase B, catalytic subunit /dihydrouracil dehydrogenase (NAD+) /dihydropyrimidine dehydrogenase (NADP+) [Halobacillus karajensis]|uniref:Dihydrothymine dehydrogenase n=1 Tax=Halobacillus karajensis TaxID=195088 RepID=A0A024P964_9BACI|nr:NAD-dependent dihydropyrimidine dehydrogenase subunit PreA [Halobacillus karajensis]CDQ20969.1 NAD-dependent dihydropyrimidine dehydrogenase subunit PreA [Halobacillus karajensis]CDQ24967.1 NAD-dependent dihydropyrimidine dehydrogenase subunit PreA [Halobacillus karajensis]CDQ28672.1 NAD-dependent dihydropyrimidine dehydrogenase subunit PreA [Halobacillus karajensis]SEH97882.1 dihydroorotate oxidase B, catalytic subunit /dihydrouracil dehydrogenase (NAD+) /dihydropyrimidine dehydrogenase (NA